MSRIAIRVDASLRIGTGHVMRCLTLAREFGHRGADVRFLCREHPGNLVAHIRTQGYGVHLLSPPQAEAQVDELAHASWLGVSQERDAADTAAVLEACGGVDALVVDHYALDSRWELPQRQWAGKLVVIDDIADRHHAADVLLDQNLAVDVDRYQGRLPASCVQLLGPGYALLREEFARARERMRPRQGDISRVLVFLGGVDDAGYTELAMDALSSLAPPLEVEVVVGATNPRAQSLGERCRQLGFGFAQGVSDMAERMLRADLAIGAGGATSWERACLGLPSVVLVAADNQRPAALALEGGGYALTLDRDRITAAALAAAVSGLVRSRDAVAEMSRKNMALVDGQGVSRVCDVIEA